MRRSSLVLSALLMFAASLSAQTATPRSTTFTDAELPAIVNQLDAELFGAYNRCDMKKFASMIDADVEFYHDKEGFMPGRDALVKSVEQYICGKVRRELVGKIEVHPISKFGAVEIGTHQFYEKGNEKPSGEAKFIHLWHYTPDGWKLTRIFSIDHAPVKPAGN